MGPIVLSNIHYCVEEPRGCSNRIQKLVVKALQTWSNFSVIAFSPLRIYGKTYAKLSDAIGLSDILSIPIFRFGEPDIKIILDDWALYSPSFKERVSATAILIIGSPKVNLVSRKLNEHAVFRFNYVRRPEKDIDFVQYPFYGIRDPFTRI